MDADPRPPAQAEARARRRAARRRQLRRQRAGALIALLVLTAAIAAAVVALRGGGSRPRPPASAGGPSRTHRLRPPQVRRGPDGTESVPVLMYHVILPAPAGAPFPGLYVPREVFAAQMHALAAAGFTAVTMDQMWNNWHAGVPLPRGKPIVISFDNGYESQYTQARPVLRAMGWVGDENLQLTGLPPSQGGLSRRQVRGLLAAGWELDTQGISHADLITLDASELRAQIASSRDVLRHRFGVGVNWFCYPSGHYDPTVEAAVRAAGYRGSTTVVPGWASPREDAFRLPRLRVLPTMSPQSLLATLGAIRTAAPPPTAYR